MWREQAVQHLHPDRGPHVHPFVPVVGVAPGAGDSVRLTAGRCAHQMVLGVYESTTSIDELARSSGAKAMFADQSSNVPVKGLAP